MKPLLIALAVLWLAGCTFQSRQLDALAGIFKKPPPSDVVWRARYGKTVVPVIAITQDPFVVFANDEGVAIAFDGWQVRSVVGFDLLVPIKIRYENGNPQFLSRGTARFAAVNHRCKPWKYNKLQTSGEWLQRCEADFFYENVIVLDNEGAIRRISQVIDSGGTRLVLEKI